MTLNATPIPAPNHANSTSPSPAGGRLNATPAPVANDIITDVASITQALPPPPPPIQAKGKEWLLLWACYMKSDALPHTRALCILFRRIGATDIMGESSRYIAFEADTDEAALDYLVEVVGMDRSDAARVNVTAYKTMGDFEHFVAPTADMPSGWGGITLFPKEKGYSGIEVSGPAATPTP